MPSAVEAIERGALFVFFLIVCAGIVFLVYRYTRRIKHLDTFDFDGHFVPTLLTAIEFMVFLVLIGLLAFGGHYVLGLLGAFAE